MIECLRCRQPSTRVDLYGLEDEVFRQMRNIRPVLVRELELAAPDKLIENQVIVSVERWIA